VSDRTIAYIAGQFPLRSETFVYREVRELRDRGWNVIACGLHPSPDRDDQNFKDLSDRSTTVYEPGWLRKSFAALLTHPLSSVRIIFRAIGDAMAPGEAMNWRDRIKLPGQAFAAIGLARTLRARNVQRIHCHFAHAPTTVGMYAARAMGIPFSFTGHANDLFQRRALLARKLQRAEFVSCISQWHRELYQSISPRETGYEVVRCGVDITQFQPSQAPASQMLRVLTVCRLVEKKGTDTLIRALVKFGQETGKPWHLVVAGDGPERKKLFDLTNELACDRSVEFVGAVDNARVRELMKETQIFALACRRDSKGDADGIPVVLMEAMACGVPVIAGDLPAIRELVEGGKNGILVRGEDVAQLATALGMLAQSESRRREMGLAGRERVVEEFSLAGNVDRMERLLGSEDERRAGSAAKRGEQNVRAVGARVI
jgi:glycosyltransferase involved in cell wall biosynthesis